MSRFKNEVAIITGAGQGIGFEIAKRLAAEGVAIVLNDLDPGLTESAITEIKNNNGKCVGLPGDSGDIIVIQRLVDTAIKSFGKVSMGILNAGVTVFSDFLNLNESAFDRIIQTNLKGSFFLAQQIAKKVVDQKSGGKLLFISSVTGHQAHNNLSAYGMTKAALENLTKHLALELSKYNIRVNALAPGATLTERTISDANYKKVWSAITPLGKPATVNDIAEAALFLLSDQAGHITGQTLVVDGGWTVVSPPPNL